MMRPVAVPVSTRHSRSWLSVVAAGAAAALCALTAGCTGRVSGGQTTVAPETTYDYYFYSKPVESVPPGADGARELVERLAGPGWEIARAGLFNAGRDGLAALIDALDRQDPTYVAVHARPGHAVPEKAETWTLGQLASAVLIEFVGGYSDYVGPLPAATRAEWDGWFKRNKGLQLRTTLGTTPKDVRDQFAAAERAMMSQYDRKLAVKGKTAGTTADRARKQENDRRAQDAERGRKQREKEQADRKAKQDAAAAKQAKAAETKAAKTDAVKTGAVKTGAAAATKTEEPQAEEPAEEPQAEEPQAEEASPPKAAPAEEPKKEGDRSRRSRRARD